MKKISICVSFLFLNILHVSCSLVPQNNDLVDQVCRKTPNYNLCISTLQSNPQAHNTDTKGIALIMVNDIVLNVNDTLKFTEGLIKKSTDVGLQKKLDFCAETYIPLVKYVLPQAGDAVNQSRFKYASYSISYAGKEIGSCNNKFSASTTSPLSDRNGTIQKLFDIASAILKLLLNG
ncbi:cell wall / vacuolar inhibitor of fructosidase 1-like [Cicer arietinum]|uniref:Cell wall / vacuolar inhibitor of fructosidase 1-like n=1 Tax=Cicer arietinum TaxID=3827 RepID=A0A1S2Z8Y8_CICAR|nr:cell wall / vacuolar inhibitor of fructosidase 1-like [Cicer arietinum]